MSSTKCEVAKGHPKKMALSVFMDIESKMSDTNQILAKFNVSTEDEDCSLIC